MKNPLHLSIMSFQRVRFLEDAVRTPSHEDVTEMRDLLMQTIEQEGYSPTMDDKGNVLVEKTGQGSDGHHLVLNTHIDTVPPDLPVDINEDVVRGRGACDAKGPLAALLDAFLQAEVEKGRLTLAVTPNEETSQEGGAYLGETVSADGYIVGEPTGLDVCVAARGSYGGHVTVRGESAHASDPGSGLNAIHSIDHVLQALESYDESYGYGEQDLLGTADIAATRVESGGPLNQVPDECRVSFDRRPIPPETPSEFFDNLQRHLSDYIPGGYEFEVSEAYPDSPNPEAFATDRDDPLVTALAGASNGRVRAFDAATEASYFADDAPTVIFGPGVIFDDEGPVAHSDREYVTKKSVESAAKAVKETINQVL